MDVSSPVGVNTGKASLAGDSWSETGNASVLKMMLLYWKELPMGLQASARECPTSIFGLSSGSHFGSSETRDKTAGSSGSWINLNAIYFRIVGEAFKDCHLCLDVRETWGFHYANPLPQGKAADWNRLLSWWSHVLLTVRKAPHTSDIDYNLTVGGNKCFPITPPKVYTRIASEWKRKEESVSTPQNKFLRIHLPSMQRAANWHFS